MATAAAVAFAGLAALSGGPAVAATSGRASCADAATPPSDPSAGVALGGRVYFFADDGRHGRELWATNGTKAGTVLVKDIGTSESGGGYEGYEGKDGGGSQQLVAVDGTLFFTADAGKEGVGLWSSDGTTAGTRLVREFADGGGYDSGYGGGVTDLTAVGDQLFFAADDGKHGTELWRSNGTKAGTAMVKDLSADDGYYQGVDNLTAVGDTAFFTVDDGTHGGELWRSDGSPAGTVLVKDINPGPYASTAIELTAVGDTVFFTARDGRHGRELWSSDGTGAGTALVADIAPGAAPGSPSDLTAVGDTVFFAADDGTDGQALWRTDGTEAGTVLVKDASTATGYDEYDHGPRTLTESNGALFFTLDDEEHGRELWVSDGSEAGTVLVDDIRPDGYGSEPKNLTDVDGTLFFSARDGEHGAALWRSDGTESGTVLVEDIGAGTDYYSGPAVLTAFGDRLFFSADDDAHGREPWISDGTAAGTALIKDINAHIGFEVSPRVSVDRRHGTGHFAVDIQGPGTLTVAPVGKSRLKAISRTFTEADRVTVTLTPTKAGMRTLRRTGSLKVSARFTFTPCGTPASSVARTFTLKKR